MAMEHLEPSGFLRESSYEERAPDWDGDVEYRSDEEAIAAGLAWVADQGVGAIVEVIRVVGQSGHVTHVVTTAGVERIE